jgi:hypothetical protein
MGSAGPAWQDVGVTEFAGFCSRQFRPLTFKEAGDVNAVFRRKSSSKPLEAPIQKSRPSAVRGSGFEVRGWLALQIECRAL